ncbi:uncharacterized protein LOC114517139 [Dendronephthya gigantea]|uniref:uncharacterized protein LOC114517139 n=1 Tax=Dendronephthya gigantea TaxID=151771 RepID=UPI00106BCD52|nr:uncharacterized protein LOC114517139 [Dendronephthya gigantea]
MVRVSISLMKVLIFSNFVILCCSAKNDTIKKVKHRINTTECSWKIRGQRYFYGNVTMHEFPDSSYNNGPHKYGVCTFKLGEVLNVTAQVDICGRHSLAIESNSSIFISAALILDWSPERNRSDTWLGGFCSRDYDLNETYGNGPGGGSCYGSAGHGGMGFDFKRGVNDMKHGWRYAFNNSNMLLIGGSSGGVEKKGSGFSCGGGAIMISSAESVTIDSNISTSAFNLNTNDSCIYGGSGGTIIIKAKTVC